MSRYVTNALFIYPSENHELTESIHLFASQNGISLIPFSENDFFNDPRLCLNKSNHVVAICTDQNMNLFVDAAHSFSFSLGVVSTTPKNRINTWFHIPTKIEDSLALAFKADPEPIDVLRCNDEAVLGMMMLGETPFLDQRSKAYQRRADSLWGSLFLLVNLILA